MCWGYGYEPRRPYGSLDATLLEVDHIRARRAAEGTAGDDELYNLALLHRTCNGVKRNRLTLEELRRYNADNGLLYVDTVGRAFRLLSESGFSGLKDEQDWSYAIGEDALTLTLSQRERE